jgi:hypothetical protein
MVPIPCVVRYGTVKCFDIRGALLVRTSQPRTGWLAHAWGFAQEVRAGRRDDPSR